MWLLQPKNKSYHALDSLFDFPNSSGLNSRYQQSASQIKQTDNDIIVSVALPGVQKKDIKLEFKDDYLYIDANSQTDGVNKEDSDYSELTSLQYSRQFYIGDINQKKSSAKLDHGILVVTLPKKEESKAQLIDIS